MFELREKRLSEYEDDEYLDKKLFVFEAVNGLQEPRAKTKIKVS